MATAKEQEWTEKRIAYIRGLKAPSDMQRAILALYGMGERSSAENRQLDALLKAEKANEKADEARAKAYKVMNARREDERKARTRELIELGGIVSMVDFPTDKGLLAGALVHLKEQLSEGGDALQAKLKARGDGLLYEREQARKAVRPAAPVEP